VAVTWESSGTITKGKQGTPNVTITMNDEDLVDLFTGKINAQQAFMGQKLKASTRLVAFLAFLTRYRFRAT
jgi:putative sterol carrier protein